MLIQAEGITRLYRRGPSDVQALRGVDVAIERGEFVAITGRSGSGKSTLMHVLGCLDRPTSGSYRLDGVDVAGLGDRALSRLRSERIGFVFQTFHLLPQASVLDNVALPFLYRGGSKRQARATCTAALERVGLNHRLDHLPNELSGGEMQRVAIARALAGGPDLILADEPTGNLDHGTGLSILELFESLATDGATLVLVTHDADVAARAQRKFEMQDGRFGTPIEAAP